MALSLREGRVESSEDSCTVSPAISSKNDVESHKWITVSRERTLDVLPERCLRGNGRQVILLRSLCN